MKNILLGLLITLTFISCQSKNSTFSDYFSKSQQDTLLTNIITYLYIPAPQATNETKFQPQFRGFYAKNIPNFKVQKYYQAANGWHYFFLIRPVGSSSAFKRGVLGKFKLTPNSLMPTEFEEVANTPHLEEKLVKERGEYLFRELIKNGNLNKQIPMKQYIEWPDEHLAYDKKTNQWITIKPY